MWHFGLGGGDGRPSFRSCLSNSSEPIILPACRQTFYFTSMSGQNHQHFSTGRMTRSRREMAGLTIIFACVAWLYGYIGIPPHYSLKLSKENPDYYNQLVDGFLAGRLSLKNDPPRALVELADPYDPAQRANAGNVGLHDVAYYQGRYYLYFGVAPALTLFLPFKALTGLHFPQVLATVLFCAGGYGFSLLLFLAVRRRFFRGARRVWFGPGRWCWAWAIFARRCSPATPFGRCPSPALISFPALGFGCCFWVGMVIRVGGVVCCWRAWPLASPWAPGRILSWPWRVSAGSGCGFGPRDSV